LASEISLSIEVILDAQKKMSGANKSC